MLTTRSLHLYKGNFPRGQLDPRTYGRHNMPHRAFVFGTIAAY